MALASAHTARQAHKIETLAHDLHSLSFDVQEQRTVADLERNEEEGTRIAQAIRRAFRG